jgi:hypothetical protein
VIKRQQMRGVERGFERRANTDPERGWTDCWPIYLNLVSDTAQYET